MNILLACNAGMSTSLLVQKMRQEAEAEGLDTTIEAKPLNKALESIAGRRDTRERRGRWTLVPPTSTAWRSQGAFAPCARTTS